MGERAISRLALGSVCRLGDGRVSVVHDAVEGVDRPQLEVGRLARQQLEHRAAERPDVGRRREGLHLDYLRRHPVGRADGPLSSPIDGCSRRQSSRVSNHLRILTLVSPPLLLRRVDDAAGDPKVSELHLPVLRDQKVGALDVSVADALCVKPLKPRQHLPHVDDEHVLGQPPKGFEDGGEGAVLDVLEDEVEVVLGADRLVEADDLRVRQVPQQLHLRLDGTGGGRRHPDERNLLNGDKLGAAALVEGAVHLARRTAPELLPKHVLGVEQPRLATTSLSATAGAASARAGACAAEGDRVFAREVGG
mmetsp:Transcript_37384/g.117571  ORF Transcript_37384/g.117571 Transcript_37384/m.117571 type:complete len:307 (+) Transcript_37384:588-1508(+)